MTTDALQTFVGPRILIKFAGAWEQAQAYEYMTAVYDSAYQSWVSKCDVPAGTPLAEGDYWIKWSDPNAQFQLLQQTVQTFDERITNNANGLASEISNREAAVSEERQARISADKATKRNALYIGNSYAAGVGATNSGLFNLTKDMFDNAWLFAGSGSGFIDTSRSEGPNFPTLLANAIASDQFDNDEITDVVIIGAWGESRIIADGNITALQTGITNFANTAKNAFPNLKRMVYYWAESRKINNIGQSSLGNEFAVHIDSEWLFGKSGIEYIGWGGFNILFNQNAFSNDNYHPNEFGYSVLANGFRSAWNGALVYKPIQNTVSVDMSTIISGLTTSMTCTLSPDTIRIDPQPINAANVADSYTKPNAMNTIIIYDFADDDTFAIPTMFRASSFIIGNTAWMTRNGNIGGLIRSSTNNEIVMYTENVLGTTKSEDLYPENYCISSICSKLHDVISAL